MHMSSSILNLSWNWRNPFHSSNYNPIQVRPNYNLLEVDLFTLQSPINFLNTRGEYFPNWNEQYSSKPVNSRIFCQSSTISNCNVLILKLAIVMLLTCSWSAQWNISKRYWQTDNSGMLYLSNDMILMTAKLPNFMLWLYSLEHVASILL